LGISIYFRGGSRTRSFFFLFVSLEFFARVYMHIRIDSSLTVASASTRRARIENWECAREREGKRDVKRNVRHLREVIFVEQEKKRILSRVNSATHAVRASVSNRSPCIRFCSASTTLLRSRNAVRERRNRRRLRHVENATSVEWLDGGYNWEVVFFFFQK